MALPSSMPMNEANSANGPMLRTSPVSRAWVVSEGAGAVAGTARRLGGGPVRHKPAALTFC